MYLKSILILGEANNPLGLWPLGTEQLSFCKFSAVYEWGNILESMHRHYSNTVQAVSPMFLSNFAYGSRDEMHAQWDIEV